MGKSVKVSSTHSRFLMDGVSGVEGDGAQLQSAAVWVRLKQCLHLETFAWPTKARFHKVGSILA